MDVLPPLLIEIKSSNLKLYFLIKIHALAVLAILLIDDFGLIGLVLKSLSIFLVLLSLNRFFLHHKESIHINFQFDDQISLYIGDQSYSDLQFSSSSYISAYFLQLILKDVQTGKSHNISIFPDAITPSVHALLRTRIKLQPARS